MSFFLLHTALFTITRYFDEGTIVFDFPKLQTYPQIPIKAWSAAGTRLWDCRAGSPKVQIGRSASGWVGLGGGNRWEFKHGAYTGFRWILCSLTSQHQTRIVNIKNERFLHRFHPNFGWNMEMDLESGGQVCLMRLTWNRSSVKWNQSPVQSRKVGTVRFEGWDKDRPGCSTCYPSIVNIQKTMEKHHWWVNQWTEWPFC